MKKAFEQVKELADVLSPTEFLQILADGAKFGEEAEKLEKELHEKLDKMVKAGELTEHEARWKFYSEFGAFTEKSSHESAMRILANRRKDNDTVDETDGEEESGEETNVDPGDPSGDRSLIDIHIHCHRNDCE